MEKRTILAGCAAALVFGAVTGVARADGASPSDLAGAAAPLADTAEGAAAPKTRDHGEGGLNCLMGVERRKPDPWDDFARPVTNLSFHHPFIWNEIRPLFIYHAFPDSGITEGGNLRAYAMQIHAKITDDVQFTAYKDGYVDFNPHRTLEEDHGWADLAFGFKFKVWENLESPAIFTLGVGYETTSGDEEVLQGGDGDLIDAFGSYARKIGPLNFIATAGFLIPLDSDEAVETLHAHAHVDLPVTDHLSALVEVNAFHYMSDAESNAGLGPSVPLGFEGFDYTNLGADDVNGNDVVTVGVGFRWFMTNDVSLGAAVELPVTDRDDVIDKRLTVDLVLRF
jgi:hypothetical protein